MGKNVLIVGASGDIGIAVAKQMADAGYSLILHYNRNRGLLEEFLKQTEEDVVLSVIQADLSTDKGIHSLLNQLVFSVDFVVFASGKAHYHLFQETTEQVMEEMLTLHVKAPWMITKQLLPSMIRRQSGKIIFITSIWGDVGASLEVVYSAVKGAQNSFVKALAKEVAQSGIAVNAISPGFIATKMNSHLSAEEQGQVIAEIPMQRAGLPSEVADAVTFLLSDGASYIQGEILHITGGW